MDITNKTRKPLSVPLPGGKKLFLGPGKSGQISPKAIDHPPLQALVEAGDLEIANASHDQGSARGGVDPAKSAGPGRSSAGGSIRRTGDR